MTSISVEPADDEEHPAGLIVPTAPAAVRGPFPGLAEALAGQPGDAEPAEPARARRRPGQGADLVASSDPATVAAAVADRIAGFVPRRELDPGVWDAVAPVVRDLVGRARPPHPDLAVNWLVQTTGLVLWAVEQRMPLRADVLLRPSTMDRYLAGAVSNGSRPTVASMLRRVASGVATAETHAAAKHPNRPCGPACPPPPDGRAAAATVAAQASAAARRARAASAPEPDAVPLEAAQVVSLARPGGLAGLLATTDHGTPGSVTPLPPYTDTQVAELLRATRALRTAARRNATVAAILLGVGAGLDGRDAPLLKPPHLTWEDSAAGRVLVVTVPGDRARRVPLLAATAEPLAEVAGRTADDRFLLGGGPNRTNRFTQLADALGKAAPRAPRLDARRLRTTWLVTHLRLGTPLPELLAAARQVTAETLLASIGYLAPLPEPARLAVLAGSPLGQLDPASGGA